MTLAHITRRLDEIEAILDHRGNAAHAAAIKHASKLTDQVLAEFMRTESSQDYIRDKIAMIRRHAELGDLDGAYKALEYLQTRLDYISQIVRAPVIATGVKQRNVLAGLRDAKNAKATRQSSAKVRQWQKEAEAIWAKSPRLSKSAVAATIKTRLAVTETRDWISRRIQKVRTPC